MNRRGFLKALGAGAMALPISRLLLGGSARAGLPGKARRVIFFYFPDGIPEPDGQPSKFHASGTETSFTLADALAPLAPFQSQCVFLNGLSMGATDAGSHPGGAKKLLTAVDGGNGESIDRYLARTVGSAAPFSHVYLGAQANQNNASGDKLVSYPAPGTTVAPEDDPLRAFQRLFGGAQSTGGDAGAPPSDDGTTSVLDTALADLGDLQAKLGADEKQKLDLHTEALRDLEKRLKGGGVPTGAGCGQPIASVGQVNESALYDPASFPAVLRAQIDVLVTAMACGATQVGVIQASQHTSELIMSRFAGTAMYTPGFDMRSHQASHYGAPTDPKFSSYVQQVTWWVSQYAYILDALKQRPEGAGTMLDYSLVLLCSEVSDGNTHKHDDMPFILGGGGGGAIRTGRLLSFPYRRHADLYVAMAQAMGDGATSFGDASSGALPGLLAP